MDPTTVIIIILSVLAGGGASGAVVAAVRRYRRDELSKALKRNRRHGERRVSVFDVFWDLGASDFALEMLRHNGLLPTDAEDVDRAHKRLDELIDSHESYNQFIDDSLEAIREFYEAQSGTGSRRQIPTLETRGRKLLSFDEGGQTSSSIEASALVPRSRKERAAEAEERLGHFVDESVDAKARLREAYETPGIRVDGRPTAPGSVIDVDNVADFDPTELLTGIFEGRFTEKLQDWWERRRLHSLKSDLDRQFEDFYDYYVEQVERTPDFYDNLFQTADQWAEEAERIAEIRRGNPLAGEPTEMAADVLLELAEETADAISRRTEMETTQAIERIHAHARRGDFAMAGYLVYLNQHAFFAGRSPEYGQYVQRIENTAHRVKEEIRQIGG